MARPAKAARLLLRSALVTPVALAVVAESAAASVFGPETPRSPNADDISAIYWVTFVIATVIAVAINIALIAAVIRFRARRGDQPARTRAGRGVQGRVAAALAVPAIAIFVLGVVFTERAREPEPSGPGGLEAALARTAQADVEPPAGERGAPLEIDVFGQQWIWRFVYPGGAPGAETFSYQELVVPVDTTVILNVTSTDVVHRWWVPALGGKVDAVPGQTAQTWFKATEEGVYRGQSANYSGSAYPAMRAKVTVVSPEAYEQWLEQQASDIEEAQAAVQKELATAAETEAAPGVAKREGAAAKRQAAKERAAGERAGN